MKWEWIKVRDKLPGCDCECVVTCEVGRLKKWRVVAKFDYFTGPDKDHPEVDAPGFYWYDADYDGNGNGRYVKPLCEVVAWMPMPEPFEED